MLAFFHHIFQAGAFAAWCFLDISDLIKCTICLALSWNVTLWWCCLVATSFVAFIVWTFDWDTIQICLGLYCNMLLLCSRAALAGCQNGFRVASHGLRDVCNAFVKVDHCSFTDALRHFSSMRT